MFGTMIDKIDTRDLILNAALERILHYGYAKTTMSEIARDCDMSAGNIYRFFPSKVDIAEAVARRYLTKVNQDLAAIVRDKSKTAQARLREIYRHELRRLYEFMQKNRNILEVAKIVEQERPNYYDESKAQERTHLKTVLLEGQETGELSLCCNVDQIAMAIQAAMMKFCYPDFVLKGEIEDLCAEQSTVFDLIFSGLAASSDESKVED